MSDGAPVIAGLTDLAVIGRGGFSTVYRARQAAAGRDVAVKVMSATLDGDGRARFERECQLLGRLGAHPGICTFYSWGETDDGHPYMVVELCQGTLRGRLEESGPLSAEEVRAILLELAATVEHAHEQGIVHRDLKPENVLVTQFDRLAITDFGIARSEDGWHTTSGVVTASLAHAAPEVLDGGEPTPASDVWSLASTGYHLLTGNPPFRRPGDVASSMVTRVFRDEPPDLRALDVPEDMCAALEAALVKDPAVRTPDMATFAAGLAVTTESPDDRTASQGPAGTTVASPSDMAELGRREAEAPVEAGVSAGHEVTAALAPGAALVPGPVGGPRRRPIAALLGAAAVVVLVGLAAWLATRLVGGDDEPGSSPGEDLAVEDAAVDGGGTDPTAEVVVSTVTTLDPRPRYCVRRVDGYLALRAEPDAGSHKLGAIPGGDCTVRDLELTEEVVKGDTSGRWRLIEWSGKSGWAAAAYLDLAD